MVLQSIIEQVSTGIDAYYLDPSLKIPSLQIQFYKCLGSVYSQVNEFPSACEVYTKAIDFVQMILNIIDKKVNKAALKKNPSSTDGLSPDDVQLRGILQVWRHFFRINLIHALELDNFTTDRVADIERMLQVGEEEETKLFEQRDDDESNVNKRLIAYYLIRVHQAMKQDYCYVTWSSPFEKKHEIITTYLENIEKEFGVKMGSEEEKQLISNKTNPDLVCF